ncbi:MAG TPA: hypothetical protein VHJ34_01495 [Actinomycetota bacterium]|nr:hypothetical protein [Actinomycetota bacterium]
MPDEFLPDPVVRRPRDHDELAERATWAGLGATRDPEGLGDATTRDVTGPGLAALNAAGGRAPRRAAATVALDAGARDNWRPTGPRNVGGRVRALAFHPGTSDVLYAATASGGVWRTVNGGESWFPLWHDEPSLAIGALAVAPSDATRLYAATGEIEPAGFNVRGTGVWTSTDSGANWTNNPGGPPPRPTTPNPAHERGFDALAVDPADARHCWAVGGDGAFRTTDGGATWQRFLDDVYVSDVAFSSGNLWLARGKSQNGEAALIRLRPPESGAGAAEAAVRTALGAAANVTTVVAPVPDDRAWPARIKLAIAASDPDVAYVRVVDEDDHHVGVFRSRNARATPLSGVTWQRLPDHPDWIEEDQGTYDLCIAVDRTEPNRVATGMVDLHVSSNAAAATAGTVTWRRAIAWELYTDLRAFHADQHGLLVVAGALWVANDGGIARSTNWATSTVQVGRQTPLAPGAISWHRRDNGLACSQAYDLNQSPLVPTLYAVGMQDNGVFLTAGGPTWRMVGGGDGAFVLFDPDDPFRFVTTWQGGIDAQGFPGQIDQFVAGEQPDVPTLGARDLSDGFLALDGPAFVADTDAHRLRRDRILHTRRRRVYGTRGARGERWEPENVGRSFEIVAGSTTDTVRVEVLPTDGATHLGLYPTVKERRFPRDPLTDTRPRPALTPVTSRLPAPFRLTAGDELRLRVNGTDVTVAFAAGDVADITKVTLAEVIAKVKPALPAGSDVLPRLWPRARAVEIVTRGRGATERIRLGGTALAPLADGLSRLGLNAGTYAGDDGRPASVTFGFEGRLPRERAQSRDLSGGLTLTVKVNDLPERAVPLDAASFPDLTNVTAGELAAALARALEPDPVDVVATDVFKGIYLRADAGRTVVVRGTAADRLDVFPTDAETVVLYVPTRRALHRRRHVRNHNSFDLTSPGPAGLRLEIRDGATTTGEFEITAADVADRRCVTVEELHRIIRRRLAATPGIRVQAELLMTPEDAQAHEIELPAARPREAWVGGADGSVFVTRDDGATWTDVTPPEARLTDARVEAIATDPGAERVAYVGLWRPTQGPADRGLLFRTETGGDSWTQIGSRRVGGALTGVVGGGRPLGIHALEIDPADARTVFAATDAGVFRTRDAGGAWEAFGEGLPNAPVVDLALVEDARLLRAAVWGRGTWERRVGAQAPDDVRLVVRTSELDDGSGRPGRAGPDVYAEAPTADPPASPDVKVVRRRPATVGADPNVDGVEFDVELPDDEVVDLPAALGGPDHRSEIVVQVHNRGSFPAASQPAPPPPPGPDVVVRVVVLWAPLTGTPPPPLPGDFWMRFKTAALNATEGEWRRGADRRLPAALRPDAPAVVGVDVTWPRDVGAPRVGVLVLVTGSDDVLEDGPTDVAELVASERRAAFKAVPVALAADDRTLVLRATGPRRFEVRNPAAGTSAATALQIAPAALGTMGRRLRAGTLPGASYALPAAQPGLLIVEEPIALDVELHNRDGDFASAAAATPAEVARFLNARARAAGAAVDIVAARAGIRLRALGGARVRVVSGNAAARLGWAAMAPGAAVAQLDARNIAAWFDLRGDRTLRLEVRAQGNHAFDVTFPSSAFDNAQFADPERIALILNRAIADNRLSGVLRCDIVRGLGIYGRREARVTVVDPSGIGIAGGPGGAVEADLETTDVTGGPHLQITVENRVTVRFDRDPDAIPTLADASPPDVRRVLNTAFEVAGMSVRADRARQDLVLRASTTESIAPVTLGAAELSDVATSGDAPAGDPRALFGVRAALPADRMKAGVVNHVYVRVANAGNVDVRPARVRLLRVDASPVPPAPPVITAIDDVAVDLDPERDAIAHLEVTPAAGPDEFEHVVAIVDQDVAARRVPDPAPADLEALVALCEARADVALRTFEVAT